MRGFLSRLSYSFSRFMAGRYGSDKLNIVLLVAAMVIEIVYSFTGVYILLLLSTAILTYAMFRMFSRNIRKRAQENQKFFSFFSELKMRLHYHIYRCPSCRQKIRVPRKGGKQVEISCPKCATKFIKKI